MILSRCPVKEDFVFCYALKVSMLQELEIFVLDKVSPIIQYYFCNKFT